MFTDGSGRSLLDSRVAGIQVMDPVTSGKYVYPQRVAAYYPHGMERRRFRARKRGRGD